MNPYFDIRSFDPAGTLKATGRARAGRIESAAGSMVHRCKVGLYDQWNGELSLGDTLEVYLYTSGAGGEQAVASVFRGPIVALRPDGDLQLVEAASPVVGLFLKKAPVKAWANVQATRVLLDLLGQASVTVAKIPAVVQGAFLHVWSTDGALLAHEVSSLLYRVAPGLSLFSSYTGKVFLGDRTTLAQAFTPFPYPTDATLRESGPDLQRVRFSIRAVNAHQAVYEPFTGGFMGTVDWACLEIQNSGVAFCEVILNRDPDSTLEAYVASAKKASDL